ncbi:hypothetical protein IAW_05980 [Bacillus cereus str. Schrouff]|uniref:hypothetical protein n=1 Tax=Bacillus cereus TaxID=1396 RepID=UPI00032E599C|nr:hypothetical protein [Bacillus cereus]EOO04776.1 hypothetical protein IAW_05980 [Bacillus cereus str. Schrouff]EOO80800.1 hypothetical protein IGY_06166 [Bacillus cereus K-5975c]
MSASVKSFILNFIDIPGLILGKSELFLFLSTGSSEPGVVVGQLFESREWPVALKCFAMGGSESSIPDDGVYLYIKFNEPLTTDARVLGLSVCQEGITDIGSAYVHHDGFYHPIPGFNGGMEDIKCGMIPKP